MSPRRGQPTAGSTGALRVFPVVPETKLPGAAWEGLGTSHTPLCTASLQCKSQRCTLQTPCIALEGMKKKDPTPTPSILLSTLPVLLRADFVLTKDPKRPYEGEFCGKIDREGSCSRAAGGPE